jgi:2-oxoisovalerate dehydrogenase E1 component
VDLQVAVGDLVEPGQLVAEIEATKSVVELRATAGGTVVEICAAIGDRVAVDSELLRIQSADVSSKALFTPVTRENPGTPRLTRREKPRKIASITSPEVRGTTVKTVGITGVVGVTGSRIVTNEELVKNWPNRTAEEIFTLTGIESRCWIGPGESILTLAADATRQVLDRHNLTIHDIDLLIACTTSPDMVTPSLACRVAAAVAKENDLPSLAAYDISAACSGYLYALAQAYDYLQQQSSARVLVVTSEILSPLLDTQDFHTSILFGDAATATLVCGGEGIQPWLKIDRPIITAKPDSKSMLCVPLQGEGTIRMQGEGVFKHAVRAMVDALRRACEQSQITIDDIDVLVPHQANRRILDAVASRAGRPVVTAMRTHGNTSSSTIPLLLDQSRRELDGKKQVGFAAFGGGFTTGAMLARVMNGDDSIERR